MEKNSFADLKRLVGSTKPSIPLLAFAGVLALLGVGAALWYPLLTGSLIDALGDGSPLGSSMWLLAGVLIVMVLLDGLSNYLLAKVGQDVVRTLRQKLTVKLVHQPIRFFDNQASGELASRVVNDSTVISTLITTHAIAVISAVFLLVGAAAVLFYLDVKLTLVLFGIILVAFLIVLPVAKKMESIAKDKQDKTAALTGILTQVFAETRLVKAFLAEEREVGRSEQHINSLYALGMRTARVNILLEPIMGFAILISLIAILGYGSVRVASGDLAVGTLTAFILYIFNVTTPLAQLSMFVVGLQEAKGASTRIVKILDSQDEKLDAGSAKLPIGKDIRFENVTFSYGEDGVDVLDEIDITIEAGKTTALVGASGSGKTTILSLIERFYAPKGGEIYCGDTPVGDISLRDWRGQLGYVPQGAPVMPGSIRDNICYGIEREVSDEELRSAARDAHCLDFIEAMDEGFEASISEQGGNISGGQRQRLAIARMFLKDPSVLILDEATSSLDSETEHHVKEALAKLMKGRTNIVVAHRLSTIVDADKIIVLEAGILSGEGSHAELVASHPFYARLVKRQFAA
ncbi:MAG: multidrug ABC transporter permease [Kordiimonadales bacterium]|nr:MAG: multidrug ABC transporter permease [Kordiimonadales bacterium]